MKQKFVCLRKTYVGVRPEYIYHFIDVSERESCCPVKEVCVEVVCGRKKNIKLQLSLKVCFIKVQTKFKLIRVEFSFFFSQTTYNSKSSMLAVSYFFFLYTVQRHMLFLSSCFERTTSLLPAS